MSKRFISFSSYFLWLNPHHSTLFDQRFFKIIIILCDLVTLICLAFKFDNFYGLKGSLIFQANFIVESTSFHTIWQKIFQAYNNSLQFWYTHLLRLHIWNLLVLKGSLIFQTIFTCWIHITPHYLTKDFSSLNPLRS